MFSTRTEIDIDRRIRSSVLVLFVCSLIFGASADARDQQVANPPNVVLIFADDLGYGDIGAYGATGLSTPNIDQIADEGVLLTDFYASPSCGLSRAMLLTGSYAPRVSLARNLTPSANHGLHQDEITIGEALQGAGYVTGVFGKWHLGDHYQFLPQRHGFDEFYGIPYSGNMWPFHPRTRQRAGEDPRLTAARDRALLTGFVGQDNPYPRGEGYPNLPLYDNDTIVEFNSDQETFGALFIDEAIKFIEENKDGRFFAYIALTAPHVPLHPSAMFAGTSARDLFGDTVQEIDAGVGRVLSKLTELAIDEKTLVLFISDNGPWLGYGIDGGSAGELSGGKGTAFEGGTRVPAVIRWPGQISGGTTSSEPMSVIDILPTLATLAGAPVPQNGAIDGVDVWPVLTAQQADLQREALFTFVENDFDSVQLGAVRSGQWKLHVDTSGSVVTPVAMYDLSADIAESTDISGAQPALAAQLLALGKDIVALIRNEQRPLGLVAHNTEPFAMRPGASELIVFEAENYHLREGRGGQDWEPVSLRHSSSDMSLQALPNSGTNRDNNYDIRSPHLAYHVAIETPGRYFVWVRTRGESGNDDSLHIGLDGVPLTSGKQLGDISDFWSWTSTRSNGERVYVDVQSAGEHVIDAWMREDGAVIDKFLLTMDPDFQPFGRGPVESRQSYDGLSAVPTAIDDGPFVIDEGGAVQGNPSVLDNDSDVRGDSMTAVLVSPPVNTAEFELRPDGTFIYVHDGSETTTDSFSYTANDIDGASNVAFVTISIVPVNDRPLLSLNGAENIAIAVGDAFVDPGAIAQDDEDGDISSSIVIGGGTPDTGRVGVYVITYDVTDSGGLAAIQVTRTLTVTDNNPPVITLVGAANVNVTRGNAYNEAGATAVDQEDGDLTASIIIAGDVVDTAVTGTYIITFNVADSSGNAADEVIRTVLVVPPTVPPPRQPVGGGGGLFGIPAILMLALLAILRRRTQAAESVSISVAQRSEESRRPVATRCLTCAIRWKRWPSKSSSVKPTFL